MTDSSGNGYVQLGDLSAGEYGVECNFKGNGAYKSSSASKSISISNAQVTADSAQSSESSGLSEDGYSYYPEYGPAVDSAGITGNMLLQIIGIIFLWKLTVKLLEDMLHMILRQVAIIRSVLIDYNHNSQRK